MDPIVGWKIHSMADTPKEAWKSINILKSWIQGHHKTLDIIRFKKLDGSFTSNEKEIILILTEHFIKVYNSEVIIDWTVLDYLEDKPMKMSLNEALTFLEFKNAIKILTLHKAPGLNGVSPNAIKALDDDNMIILFEICSKHFEGDCDILEWQVGTLTILPKKRDLINPNNLRGINLLNVVSKTISIVIISRLQTLLLIQGMPTQFRSIPKNGCPDGSFSIKKHYCK